MDAHQHLRHMYRLDIPVLLGCMAEGPHYTLQKGVDGGHLIVVIFYCDDSSGKFTSLKESGCVGEPVEYSG